MYSKVNTKVNSSEKKLSDAINLIHKNQNNIDKQNLEKIQRC